MCWLGADCYLRLALISSQFGFWLCTGSKHEFCCQILKLILQLSRTWMQATLSWILPDGHPEVRRPQDDELEFWSKIVHSFKFLAFFCYLGRQPSCQSVLPNFAVCFIVYHWTQILTFQSSLVSTVYLCFDIVCTKLWDFVGDSGSLGDQFDWSSIQHNPSANSAESTLALIIFSKCYSAAMA